MPLTILDRIRQIDPKTRFLGTGGCSSRFGVDDPVAYSFDNRVAGQSGAACSEIVGTGIKRDHVLYSFLIESVIVSITERMTPGRGSLGGWPQRGHFGSSASFWH